MRSLIPAIVVWLSFFNPLALRADNVVEDGKALIRSMYAARRQLQRGVVRLRGVRESFDPNDLAYCYQFPVNADAAFDWPAGRLRYDAEIVEEVSSYGIEEFAEAVNLSEVLDNRAAELVTGRMYSVLTPHLYACYMAESTPDRPFRSGSNIEIFDSDTNAATPVVQLHYCFDVRSVGLFNFWEFCGQTHVMGYQPADSCFQLCDLETAVEQLLAWPVTDIERDGDLTRIRFLSDMTITLSESQGFTPIAYHHYRGLPGSDHIEDTVASAVKWEQRNDVWVPVRFMIERLDADGEGTELRHTYTMEWSHVNQPIPEHYFDFRTFPDVQEGTLVYDHRIRDEPVEIGTWSEGQFVESERPDTSMRIAGAERSRGPWRRLWRINGIILLGVLGGSLIYRLSRRRAA